MLKKELRDSLWVLLESSIFLLSIPIMFFTEKFFKWGWDTTEVFSLVFIITMVVYAILSGLSLWQSEKKEDAFEYLLSIPLSRLRVLAYKFLPRFGILLVLIILFGILFFTPQFPTTAFFIVVVFLIAVFLSITISTMWISFIEIGLLYFLVFTASRKMPIVLVKIGITSPYWTLWLSLFFVGAFLLIPLGAAFWSTIKNMDARHLKVQFKSYLIFLLPVICLLLGFIIIV